MRTTIELDNRQRSELAKIAASRGRRGFSAVVREAVDFYLRERENVGLKKALEQLADLRGSITKKEAEEWKKEIRRMRRSWR